MTTVEDNDLDNGMINPVAIFGGKGGGSVVADYSAAATPQRQVIGFLNDVVVEGSTIDGYPVLGPFSSWKKLPADVVFNAPLHKARHMPRRKRIIDNLEVPEARWVTIRHPMSTVSASASIGAGCSIGPFCTVHCGAAIGRHVTLRHGAMVAHDVVLGEYVFVGANAVIAGYASIGEGAHVAPSSVVREHVKVGRFAVVGLGSVVLKDVDDFAIVVGVPARQIDTVTHQGTIR